MEGRRLPDFEKDEWRGETGTEIAPAQRDAKKPTPGRWLDAAKGPVQRPIPRRTLFLAAGGALAVGIALTILLGTPIPFVVALFGILAAVVPPPTRPQGRIVLPSKRDLALLENPEDPDVCLVEMEIVEGVASVGIDRGVVWFEGGRLLFNGHRTSFALGGEDVLPRREWRRFDRADFLETGVPQWAVPLNLPDRTVYVRLKPIPYATSNVDLQEILFTKRLEEFRLRPPSSGGAPRQWPPFHTKG